MTVSSLKAQFSVGPGVLYGTKIEQVGISANASYDFTAKCGAMAGYTYFFEKNSLKWWALDFDGTYSFASLNDKSKFYALAGLNLLYYQYPDLNYTAAMVGNASLRGLDISPNKVMGVAAIAANVGTSSISYTGVNIGAGWKLGISKKMDLVPEVRYTLGNANYLRISVKLMFGL